MQFGSLQELGTRVEPIPRDIDKKLYVFDPASMPQQGDDDEDDLVDETSELTLTSK